jgi:PDDEXK-like domain of unknown function (DUF3799)
MITAGIHYDMTSATYLGDPCPTPSLSNSIAQILLAQSPRHAFCAHPKLNPHYGGESSSGRLDLGSVAHKLLLGKGRGIKIIDAENFRTKAAQSERDLARAAGLLPILATDYERALAMVEIARSSIAMCKEVGRTFFAANARMESVVIWREGDCWARAMLDCTDIGTVLDYKSCTNASPDYVVPHLYRMGYHIQRSWYLRGLDRIDPDGAGRRRFIFIFQEIDEPHAVTFFELDGAGATMGDRYCDQATRLWQECMRQNQWPAYDPLIHRAEMPAWMESSILAREIEQDEQRRAAPDLANVLLAG